VETNLAYLFATGVADWGEEIPTLIGEVTTPTNAQLRADTRTRRSYTSIADGSPTHVLGREGKLRL